MKKILIFIFLATLSITSFGQINFEKGYFIDNQNQKIDCYIKNSDWLKNPSSFKYKLSEEGEMLNENITNIKEFSIPNSFKFIRTTVAIDISPSELKNLSTDKNPIWQNKQLFLKVLVEGHAKLYYYYDGEIDERFFYSNKDTIITQLIYKEYIHDIDHTAINDTFRLQLRNNVRCSFADDVTLPNLAFTKSELVNYFIDYNTCIDPSFKNPFKKQKKGEFSLSILAGLSYSSLSISNESRTYINTDFDDKLIKSLTLEIEYIFPFNNRKWGIVLSPTYQSLYHSEKNDDFKSTTIDFESIDFAVGIKHYLFLSPGAKLFFDCYINSIWNYPINSKIGYKVNTTRDFSYLPIDEMYNTNFILGIGLEYKKISAELKYFTKQNILSRYSVWDSSLEKVSLSIGYKFLKTKKNE